MKTISTCIVSALLLRSERSGEIHIYKHARTITYLLMLPLTHCPRGGEAPGGTWERPECEGKRKGREKLRHGAGTVPQVPHRQGSGVGGTGEEVCRGVGCTTAGGITQNHRVKKISSLLY